MLKTKDKIDNQLLPIFEEENHFVLSVIISVYLDLDQSLIFPPWMQKDVVVDVNVADPIEKGLVKGLQAILKSFVCKENVVCPPHVKGVSCYPVYDCHEKYVTSDEHNHRVKVPITKRVGEQDKGKEP